MSYRIEMNSQQNSEPIVHFLREHWNQHHVFVRHPELLKWQHLDKASGSYNFVIATKTELGAIHALMGYIPMSHFDPNLSSRQAFLAIWKAAEECQVVGLGLALLKQYIRTTQHKFLGAIGLSAQVLPIYRSVLHFQVGKMKQFVIFSSECTTPKIAHIPDTVPRSSFLGSEGISLRPLNEGDLIRLSADSVESLFGSSLPRKSPAYLVNRYLRHHWFSYECLGVIRNDAVVGIVVLRNVVRPESGHVYRIVDFCGDDTALAAAAGPLANFCRQNGAEYVDLVCGGVDAHLLVRHGYIDRADVPGLIVPNYFEPFEARNVDLDYAFKATRPASVRLFKGDSDQDRPNLLDLP